MPFEITNEGTFFFTKFYGVVTPADLDQLADETASFEDSLPEAMDRISDITAVERFDVGFPSISSLASRRRVRKFSRPVKSAIVYAAPVQFGLARMFKTLNDNPQIDIQLWPSLAEAKEWIAQKTAE